MQYHLVLYQFRTYLTRETVLAVRDDMDRAISTPPAQTQIDVWLNSPGGDAHAAYKLMLELRARASRVRFVVPDYAKSAATLMTLGADEIFMGASSELGPLDVQLEHHDREGTRISGLDVTGALEYVLGRALDMALVGGGRIKQYTQLPRGEVLSTTLQFMADVLTPAVDKLDPDLIHQAAQQLDVAKVYGKLLLRDRRLADNTSLSAQDISRLMEKLVSDYPAHEFVISRDEARDGLQLPVNDSDAYPRWGEAVALYRKAYDDATNGGDGDICRVIPDSEFPPVEDDSTVVKLEDEPPEEAVNVPSNQVQSAEAGAEGEAPN